MIHIREPRDGTVRFRENGYTISWKTYTFCGLYERNHFVFTLASREHATCDECILLAFEYVSVTEESQ